MATNYLVFPSSSPNILIQFADSTECSTVEIRSDAVGGSVELVQGNLDEAALSEWLNKAGSGRLSPHSAAQEVLHSLQVLMIPLYRDNDTSAVFGLTEKSFRLAKKHFNLHEHFISIMTNQHTRAFSHSATRSDEISSETLLFKGRFHPLRFFQLAIKYVPGTKTTHAILVFNPKCKSPANIDLRFSLHAQMKMSSHPLVLPVYLAEQHIDFCTARIHEQNCKLDEVQIMTGQYSSSDYFPGVDLFTLEFTEMTRLLNTSAEITTHQVFTLKGLSTALPVLKTWGASLPQLRSECQDRDTLLTDQVAILDKLEYINGAIVASLIHAEHVEKRIETYRQLIYHLMAQKGSRTNLEVAKSSAAIAKSAKEDSAVMRQIALETKRDSSAMKTIAMLTMFFLPGTFVAAIFAMPVFEWDGTSTPAIKSGFKSYWAITVPLTVTVFLLWGAATILPWRSWVGERLGKKTGSVISDRELDELEHGGRMLKYQLRSAGKT
ncbi:hypothetical protein DL98DRAFT_653191 [Cadophora sp. DSE1049]|nr:hypothetical protein DL98DRAFT_653191 [Cadophora sp. DSE1049]